MSYIGNNCKFHNLAKQRTARHLTNILLLSLFHSLSNALSFQNTNSSETLTISWKYTGENGFPNITGPYDAIHLLVEKRRMDDWYSQSVLIDINVKKIANLFIENIVFTNL